MGNPVHVMSSPGWRAARTRTRTHTHTHTHIFHSQAIGGNLEALPHHSAGWET